MIATLALCACSAGVSETPRPVAAIAGWAHLADAVTPREAPPEPASEVPNEAPASAQATAPTSACNEQLPQPFLIRSTYAFHPDATAEEAQHRKQRHRKAIEYRTRRYGFVEGFGDPAWNAREPKDYSAVATFFGIRVRMNARVLVALGCVEEAIRQACGDASYVPRVLDGLRLRNTFHDGEVSNHTYGIALDIDPNENSCCGCVPPLSEWPRCKEPAASPYERTRIPKCWVDAFERFGFYWLGNDPLEDTMHFEFLGDPAKIRRTD